MGERILFVPPRTVYRIGGEWEYPQDGIRQADIDAADAVPRGEEGGIDGKFYFGANYKYEPSPAVVEILAKAGFKDLRRVVVSDEPTVIHHTGEAEYTANTARKEIGELRERVERLSKTVFALEARLKEPTGA